MMIVKRIKAADIRSLDGVGTCGHIMVRAMVTSLSEGIMRSEIGIIVYDPMCTGRFQWTIVFQGGGVGSDYPTLKTLLRNELDRGQFEFYHVEMK